MIKLLHQSKGFSFAKENCFFTLKLNIFSLFIIGLLSFQGHSQCVTPAITTYPYSEDFESSIGVWTQGTGDAGDDWTRDSGGTPSNNTGPSAGAGGDTWYMYIEASTSGAGAIGYPNEFAYFDSPCFDLTAITTPEFIFNYHMFGGNVGTLNVDISTDNGSTYPTNLWTQSGNVQSGSGDAYNTVNLDLTAYVGQTVKLRFTGYSGPSGSNGWGSDIAIDNVSLVGGTLLPEIDITGLGNSIIDGDSTPSVGDDTDFGNVDTAAGTAINTFTIQNTGTSTLTLTGTGPTYVAISGTNAADFMVTANPSSSISASGSTTFNITFNPSAVGLRTATLTIANDDSDEDPYNFDIQGTGTVTAQEINVTGLGNTIVDGDAFPTSIDNTDFGNVLTTSGTQANTFIIENIGTVNNLLLTSGSPYAIISGANAADFTVTTIPTTPITASSNTLFIITFDPSADGLRQAIVTIGSNDSDEGTYNFNIQGTGITPPPCGSTIIHTADFESSLDGWTDGGTDAARVNNAGRSYSSSYSLEIRSLDGSGNNSSVLSPLLDLSGYDKVDFKFFFTAYNVEDNEEFIIEYSNNSGSSWTVVSTYHCGDTDSSAKEGDYLFGNTIIFYGKTATLFDADFSFSAGTTSQFRVRSDASDTTDLVYIDNITITGTEFCTPITGPGGVITDLDLWLKADQIDGSSVAADASNVSQWIDTGKGNHAEVVVAGQEPVYRNSTARNFNFNPVVDFENNHNTAYGDMTYINTRDELQGTGGFNSDDTFLVIMPDPNITTTMFPLDTFTSKDPTGESYAEDVTGVGYGGYTARISGEYFTYCIGTTSSGDGYGRADTSGATNYNQISIINVRHNSGDNDMEIYHNANQVGTTTNDQPDFASINNTRYWLGRSQFWNGSFDGRIAEVISYSDTNGDASLVDDKNKIESYLAIKYGITLGVNGTSQDYVDSAGSVIWNQSVNSGYNYHITGIGRDDDSELNQKQSKTVNTVSDITIGLTDIEVTNSANGNAFSNNRNFLVWGNDQGTLAAESPVVVDMSSGIGGLTSNVDFTSIGRTWKVVESGTVGTTKVSIPEIMLSATLTPPGAYLMFISNTATFSPTSEYRIMTVNGSNLETAYNFNGTKFITFGYAPERTFVRSIYFDGATDYLDAGDVLDLTGSFSISSWIKRDTGEVNADIVSKRNGVPYTDGYSLRLDGTGRPQMIWKNSSGSTQTIQSSIVIPENEWHHIAVTYNGTDARIYIDGVIENAATAGLDPPVSSTERFLIAAADYSSLKAYFKGNIDEVRVWNIALTEDQLHYIMNQEIEDNTNVAGSYFTSIGVTPTKEDIATIPWSNLQAYYPMSTYTYTNAKDESDNNYTATLVQLTTVDFQTAPLPYTSTAAGIWTTSGTWTNGNVQTIPGATSIVDSNKTVDWNIVSTSHNITMDNSLLPVGNNDNRTLLGLIVNSNELTIDGTAGNGITISHYLELDGVIDLEGESQLIQTAESDLATSSSGYIEKDQQGTANSFTYNYWSSPVSLINSTSNNTLFSIEDVLRDGTNSASPITLNFESGTTLGSVSAYYADGAASSSPTPQKIAKYWLWTYNNSGNDYANWDWLGSTHNLSVTEGYTMKGISNVSSIATNQNYVFRGKPNNVLNGNTEIVHTNFTAPSDPLYPDVSLTGNPFPSALDADQFITDNLGSTNGQLYFWEHWGGGSHEWQQYQGGYATRVFGIGNAATSHPDVDPTPGGGKIPGQYVPVGQGFYVISSAAGGNVVFNNGQRQFVKEGGSSVFVRQTSGSANNLDDSGAMIIGLGFESSEGFYRPLSVGFGIEEATDGFDKGYDGRAGNFLSNDALFIHDDKYYVIQSMGEFNEDKEIPLVIFVDEDNNNATQTFMIDRLVNVPEGVEIYIKDNDTGETNSIQNQTFEFSLPSGEHKTKFSLVFKANTLSVDEANLIENGIDVFMNNSSLTIDITKTVEVNINKVTLFNYLGQTIQIWTKNLSNNELKLPVNKTSTGAYILKIETKNRIVSKKLIIE